MSSRILTVAQIANTFKFNRATQPLLLKGAPVAAVVESCLKKNVQELVSQGNRPPCLAIVLATENPASVTYVKKKIEACGRIGMDAKLFQEKPEQGAIESRILQLNEDPNTDGIILQLPVPGINTNAVFKLLDPEKDIDGITTINAGHIVQGRPGLTPCTPLGIYVMLRAYGYELQGRNCVIVGKSDTVGAPLATLLSKFGHATVTNVDISTLLDLSRSVRRNSDIQIIAAGIPEAFDRCRPGSTIIDVGIHQKVDHKTGKKRLVGDVNHDIVNQVALAVSPVPGGVGPMTVSMVTLNTLMAYSSRLHGVSVQDMMNEFLTTRWDSLPQNTFRYRILLISSANNGMTQLFHQALKYLGYAVAVHITSTEDAMLQEYREFNPDLILAPMLKQKIPEEIYNKTRTLIVHPGIVGDRGPSSIDWALMEKKPEWGVTILEASDVMDAGDVYATQNYAVPAGVTKSEMYNAFGTWAARESLLHALTRFHNDQKGTALNYDDPAVKGTLRPTMKQADRKLHWEKDSTADIVRKIRAGDGSPGVADVVAGEKYFLYDAFPEGRLGSVFGGKPGNIIALREKAICIKTTDGAVWVGHLRKAGKGNFKNAATRALPREVFKPIPICPIDYRSPADHPTYQKVFYSEQGEVGTVTMDFYNGAMRTDQCQLLTRCLKYAKTRPTKVLILKNARYVWSNGINLNSIEGAPDPAEEAWANINAIDDSVEQILSAEDHITISVMGGNAGAGGVPFARAADIVVCPTAAVLNPHYVNMGLFGSEYWTYTLPNHIGADLSSEVTKNAAAMMAESAQAVGLVDHVVERGSIPSFVEDLVKDQIARYNQKIEAKRAYIEHRQHAMPISLYREMELTQMKENIFRDSWGFAEKRYKFVHKL